jgi:hypothetical protein
MMVPLKCAWKVGMEVLTVNIADPYIVMNSSNDMDTQRCFVTTVKPVQTTTF